MTVIETERLTMSYGSHRGIVDVDLAVEEGEIRGFLGPDGAGKTTTIRLLLELIRPTSGAARVFGIRSSADPGANLRGGVDERYRSELIARFDLDPSRRYREYSKGDKQKVGLVIALQHRPDLLMLDEPTSGLDPLVDRTILAHRGRQAVEVDGHVR